MSGEKQHQGEKRVDFIERVRAVQRAEYDSLMAARYPLGKRERNRMRNLARKERSQETYEDRLDDLGESQD